MKSFIKLHKSILISNNYFTIVSKKQFKQKLLNKQYLEIIGIKNDPNLHNNQKDLHRAYLKQIKKFHSDNFDTEEQKKQSEEIVKCIIQAYELLKIQKGYSKLNSKQQYQVQQQLSQKLFNKSYQSIKYSLYQEGNQQKRKLFVSQLAKYKEQNNSKSTSTYDSRQQRYNSYQPNHTNSTKSSGLIFSTLAIVGGIGLFAIFKKDNSNIDVNKSIEQAKLKNKVRQFTQQQLKIIQRNTKIIASKPYQRCLNKFLSRRPHILNYPTNEDPHILDQLVNYSCAQDIHLYEIPSKYFLNKQDYEILLNKNSDEQIEKYLLSQTKPNTLLSLSLQAQRVLQNVYVKVEDVLEQIKIKGKFEPPKVLFKYMGYMMVEVRRKTFATLQNYKNKQYISLFDLYFDYYSPIPFKRDHYNQYLTGLNQDDPKMYMRYFGHVNLNHRPIPTKYIGKNQKIVMMKDVYSTKQPNGFLKPHQQMFLKTWQNFYEKYEKNWKQYSKHQMPSA